MTAKSIAFPRYQIVLLVRQFGIEQEVMKIAAIALLAGPGSIFSSAIIAVLVKFGLGLDWIPALPIGVILANTDTVSTIAVFKEIRVPSRLSTIVEGETLFNDAAALISFGTDSLGLFVISGAALVRSPHSATLAARFLR